MLKHWCRYLTVFMVILSCSLGFTVAQARPDAIKVCGQYKHKNGTYSRPMPMEGVWGKGQELNKIANVREFNRSKFYLLARNHKDDLFIFETKSKSDRPAKHEKIYKEYRSGILWKIRQGWDKCR